MSSIQDLEAEGLLTKRQLKALKIRAKAKARLLKRQRNVVDALARKQFKLFQANGRSWNGLKEERAKFRAQMTKRHKLHERIAKLVPEPVEPEWDSP